MSGPYTFFGFPGFNGAMLYRSLHEASHAARQEADFTGEPVIVNRYISIRLTRRALLDIINSHGGRWVAECLPIHTIQPSQPALKALREAP
jgi:hypothetical protein